MRSRSCTVAVACEELRSIFYRVWWQGFGPYTGVEVELLQQLFDGGDSKHLCECSRQCCQASRDARGPGCAAGRHLSERFNDLWTSDQQGDGWRDEGLNCGAQCCLPPGVCNL